MPCDLVTGEERVYANEDARPAPHIACTIEMCSTNTPCMYTWLFPSYLWYLYVFYCLDSEVAELFLFSLKLKTSELW